MRHSEARRVRIELAMAEADEPRWYAAADRIAQRMADNAVVSRPAAATVSAVPPQLPPPEDDLATPVLTEDDLFNHVFAEAELQVGPTVAWLPVDHSESAKI